METLTFRDLPLFCSFTAPDVIIRPVRGRPSRRIKGFREVAGCSTGIMVIKPRGDRHHVATKYAARDQRHRERRLPTNQFKLF